MLGVSEPRLQPPAPRTKAGFACEESRKSATFVKSGPLGRRYQGGRGFGAVFRGGRADFHRGGEIMLATIEKVMLLKQTALFSRIPGEELARLAEVARQLPFEADDCILESGKTCDALYCLIEGEVSVVGASGLATVVRPVALLGEVSLFDGEPSDHTATALTPATVLEWSSSLFFALLEDRSELARGMVSALARRVRAYVAASELRNPS